MNIVKRTLAAAMIAGVALAGGGIANADVIEDLKPKPVDCAKKPTSPECAPPIGVS